MTQIQSKQILFIAPSAYTLSGLATWLDYLLPGLRELGWNVTLGLVAGPRHHLPKRYLKIHPDPQTVSILNRTGTEQGRRRAVSRVIKKLTPDLVVTVNVPDAIAAVAELRANGKTNARAIMTCHGIQSNLYKDMYYLRDRMDAIICTNQLACHFANELGKWDRSQIYHAPCGVELIDASPVTSVSQSSCERFTFAYVGRLEQQHKLIYDLKEILANLKELDIKFELLIAGDGPDKAELERNLAPEIKAGDVRFLGLVPSEKLSEQVYSKIDALLVTSISETGPIVIWEAMAHNVAVVSSRYIGSGKENLLHHRENCLLYDLGDLMQAAKALSKLANDHSLRMQIAANGWRTVQSQLTKEISTQNWSNALSSILEQPLRKLIPLEQTKKYSGRLANFIGEEWAEWFRERFPKTEPDNGSGGEWPHRLPGMEHPSHILKEPEFWDYAKQHDLRETIS